MAAAVQSAPGSHIQGWMSEKELYWLFQQARRMRSVAEIGCWKGRSTYALCASGCPSVYAVDHFRGSDEPEHKAIIRREGSPLAQFAENMAHFSNLHTVIADSVAAANLVPDVDMVFLDASHDSQSFAADLTLWRPKAKKLLCGHDFYFADVQNALAHIIRNARVVVMNDIWSIEVEEKAAA